MTTCWTTPSTNTITVSLLSVQSSNALNRIYNHVNVSRVPCLVSRLPCPVSRVRPTSVHKIVTLFMDRYSPNRKLPHNIQKGFLASLIGSSIRICFIVSYRDALDRFHVHLNIIFVSCSAFSNNYWRRNFFSGQMIFVLLKQKCTINEGM